MRRLLYLLPILLVAALLAVFWHGLDPDRDPHALPSALIGKPVPALELASLQEGAAAVSLAALKGQPVAINFFASWCLPCRAEHPMLGKIAAEYGIKVIGIAYKDKPDDAKRFLGDLGDPFRAIGLDQTGRTAIEWGVYGVPESYFVDPAGIVRWRYAGPITPDVLDAEVRPLLRRYAA